MKKQRSGSKPTQASQKQFSPSLFQNKVPLLLLPAICAVFIIHVMAYDFLSDDAFIVIRYAKNFIEGRGLVFNPGEKVEGFTSLLWCMILAAAGAVHFDPVEASRVLGTFACLAAVVFTYGIASKLLPSGQSKVWALIAPVLLVSNGTFACWSAGGLETGLFICLTAASFLAVMSGRYWLSAILAFLTFTARPEGLLVAGLLGAYQIYLALRRQGKNWIGWWAVCGGATLAVFVFRLAYFGDPLPNTFYAKTGGTWHQWHRGLIYMADYARDHEGLPILIIPLFFFLLKGERVARLLAAGALLILGSVVWVGGDGLPMYRLAVTPLPLIFPLQACFFERLHQYTVSHWPGLKRIHGTLLVTVLLGLLVIVQITHPIRDPYWNRYLGQKNEVPRWKRIGLWFKENAKPGETLATVPIGAVSYYSGLTVYDMVGLTDRHIARRKMPDIGKGWAGHEKFDGQYILSRSPTYLLLGNIDVTDEPRDPDQRPFIPYSNPFIWDREKDIYVTDLIYKRFKPRSVKLNSGRYLNFFELKEEYRTR